MMEARSWGRVLSISKRFRVVVAGWGPPPGPFWNRLLDFSTTGGGGDRELQPWPESSPSHLTVYLGSPFPDPKALNPMGFRGMLV